VKPVKEKSPALARFVTYLLETVLGGPQMYYEEKQIDGVWYFRDTPNGEWRKGRAAQRA
jgi:hypothetical protein